MEAQFVPETSPVCPWDNPVCPRDKPGSKGPSRRFVPGTSPGSKGPGRRGVPAREGVGVPTSRGVHRPARDRKAWEYRICPIWVPHVLSCLRKRQKTRKSRVQEVSRNRSRIIRPSLIAPKHNKSKVLVFLCSLREELPNSNHFLNPQNPGSFVVS